MLRRKWRPAFGRSRVWGVALVLAATTGFVAGAGSAPGAPVSTVVRADLATAGPGRTVHAVVSPSPPAASPEQRSRGQLPLASGKPTPVEPGASRRGSEQPQSAVSAATDLKLFRLSDLGAGHGSLVNEPSVASNGVGVLETWNWYAARSLNGGATWGYMDPSTLFPATWGGFCCEQVVQYDPSHDLYIWVLDYLADGSGDAGLRLAVANGQAGLAANSFTYWDLTPDQVNPSWTGQYYDLPKIALTGNNLFLTASTYAGTTWKGSPVLRFSLDDLAAHADPLNYTPFVPAEFGPGLTQGATTTMYFGVHVDTTHLKVYSWPDSSPTVNNNFTVMHTAYPNATPVCLRTGAPASANWCARADDRLPNGWVSQGKIGFAWTASQGTVGTQTFPYPYIHAVRIDETTHALVDQPIIWSSSYAFADPSIAPNARGDLGGTYLYGGGPYHENCGGLIRDSVSGNAWQLFGLTSSTADPSAPQGGDYLSTRKNGGNPNTWSGACYAVTGGGAPSGVHTYFLSFGRDADSPFPGAPTNVTATGSNTQFSYSAKVSWAPPASNGGHPVTNYVITPYLGSTSLGPRVVGNVTSFTFTGLGEGGRYSFAVAAANAFGVGAASSSNSVVYCYGFPATKIGTDGPDTLIGTAGPDVIAGLGGNDQLKGGGGDDAICGGTGNDTVLGQDGTDVLLGDDGNDTVNGGTGFLDLVVGGQGNDVLGGDDSAVVSYLFATSGVTLDLGAGTASGGEGSDTLTGFAYVFGSPYNDTLRGNGLGNIFFPGTGNDVVDGGDGFDDVAFSRAAVQAQLGPAGTATGEGSDQLVSIEGLAGFNPGESFVGDANDNFFFFGTGGSGVVHAGGGDDRIIGDAGNDQFFGDAGNDFIEGGGGANAIDGGSGNDEVSYEALTAGVTVDLAHGTATTAGGNPQDSLKSVETVSGTESDDTLTGNGVANALIGNDGNDTLVGNAGNDFLNGGAGSDTAYGGAGTTDYCLDTEQTHTCEVKRKSGGALAGSTSPEPQGRVSLGDLVDHHSQPTCKSLGHGRGVTTIGPPTGIKLGKADKRDVTVDWQATLYRKKGKRKKVRVKALPPASAPLKTSLKQGSLNIPTDWRDLNNKGYPRKKSVRLGRGQFWWEEKVTLHDSDTHASGKIEAYYHRSDSAAAGPGCTIH
jgi:Ca2+-binding RTX toxin-like protein